LTVDVEQAASANERIVSPNCRSGLVAIVAALLLFVVTVPLVMAKRTPATFERTGPLVGTPCQGWSGFSVTTDATGSISRACLHSEKA
jgi:hypothetical protein